MKTFCLKFGKIGLLVGDILIIDLVNIPKDGLKLDESINFEGYDLKSVGIEELKDVKLNGSVKINIADEVILKASLSGTMVLLDAIDSSEIEYPFNIEIDENLTDNDEYNFEKTQNTLDIMNILWQNIVLEVPMRVVKKENENASLQGEGWELISDDTKKVDPRLSPLMDLLNRKE